MRRILRDKLIELVRGEEGVAFVVTLGVFFFMYLVIAGVYAVGTSVRERIHLQNACDAAAYSAAVVQADTLSRIATLNRAMSWTYVQMTKRQMDWVTYRWLDEACRHWDADHARAKSWAGQSTAICADLCHHGQDFNVGPMRLYGATYPGRPHSKSEVSSANSNFLSSHVGGDDTFYANRSSMTGQIQKDWESIEKMVEAIRNLKSDYQDQVEKVAKNVFRANVLPGASYQGPLVDCQHAASFMKQMKTTQEDRFLMYDHETPSSAFDNAGSSWFVQRDSKEGFLRGFAAGVLKAEWDWYSNQWHCKKSPYGQDIHVGPIHCPGCTHLHDKEKCFCKGTGMIHATVYADNNRSGDEFYSTPSQYAAKPEILTPSYFGEEGTITVCAAVDNENPWCSVMPPAMRSSGLLSGLLAAFNHFCKKTIVVSSAKAGYKYLESYMIWDEEPQTGSRGYRIDWRGEEDAWNQPNQRWNLCQSDWDAVFVPVRMAHTMARDGKWEDADHGFLAGLIRELGVSDSEMYSGGNDSPNMTIVKELDDDGGTSQTRKKWRWYNASNNRDYNSKLVQAQWQIEKHGVSPNWNRLTDRMFH